MFSAINSLIASGSGVNLLITMIVLPAVLALIVLVVPRKAYTLRASIFSIATILNLLFALSLYFGGEMTMIIPWAGFEVNLALRVYNLSQFMLLAAASIAFLVGLYSVSSLRNKAYNGNFLFYYLLTLALMNGAFLANNLVVMLFFWEGLLVTLFAMIIIGNSDKPAASTKALIVNSIADLLLMLGIAATALQAETVMMDVIVGIPIEGLGILGFVCMMLGAIGKMGVMPFHSWIPDASSHAPLPFMAILPAALQKMVGVYLLVRILGSFYDFNPGSNMSILVMAIGVVTVVLAMGMALIQKDMKRLLSFVAIGEAGYVVLGLGTALPAGIIGGFFHMINLVIFICCLFLIAGAVEKQTGTTDLDKISGIGRFMPITAICFIVAALSVSSVPLFNGFFSKQLIFQAARDSGLVFYVPAMLGVFLTAAVFLKLGHSLFFGPVKLPENIQGKDVKEAPGAMLLPVIVLAGLSVFFGVWNALPLSAIQPLLYSNMGGLDFAGWPSSMTVVLVTVIVLLLALLNHYIGFRSSGSGLKSADHIHHMPILRQLYNGAEKHYFDPYDIFMQIVKFASYIFYCIDRSIDWIYDVLIVKVVSGTAAAMRSVNNGSTSRYIYWMLSGVALLLLLFILLVQGGVK